MQITELSYLRPDTVEQAVEALGAWGGGAVPLAGGMSLLPDMHLGVKRPRAVVSLARLARLANVDDDARHLRVGAMVTHRRLASDPLVLRRAPALAEAAAGLADVQVRNRGTVGEPGERPSRSGGGDGAGRPRRARRADRMPRARA